MADTTPTLSDDAALRAAKRPRNLLAGPYGHPFHPFLVTIPIGAWIASLVFDLLALVLDDDAFATGAAWLIVIGLVGALFAIVTGLLDFSKLTPGTKVHKIALTHLFLNLAASALFAVNAVVRFTGFELGDFAPGLLLTILGLGLLGVSGILGGELVFRHGVRVADETTQVEAHAPQAR
jgi:uncharacterized membrane protein